MVYKNLYGVSQKFYNLNCYIPMDVLYYEKLIRCKHGDKLVDN